MCIESAETTSLGRLFQTSIRQVEKGENSEQHVPPI